MTYFSFFKAECLVLWRNKQDVLNSMLFFIMVVILFPLGIDASPNFLMSSAGGIIWCAAALAILMSMDGLFKDDYNDGSLEQWVVSGLSLPLLALLKMAMKWGAIMFPMLIIAPLLAQMLYLFDESFLVMMATLLLGTPCLFLIGAIGSALTVSIQQGGVLLILLILPFYLPVIIFATSAIQLSQAGLSYAGLLAILLAISLFSLVVAPFMTAISIKASVK